jgi:ABC-type sugar transport system permease subunit
MTRFKGIKPYLYLVPAFFFLVIFTYYPIFRALYLSLFKWSTSYPVKVFTGFSNYVDIFTTPLFWKVTQNSLIYSVSTIVISMSLGLFLAVQINKRIRLSTVYKVSLFYPTMIPMAAASLIWMWMYIPSYGLFDFFLSKLGIPSINWLNDERIALWSIVAVGVWKYVGYYMILFLAGLQNIPASMVDAAIVEGANNRQRFFFVTFPMISSYTFFIFIINIINSLQAIDQVYIMTQGGPANSTNLIVYYIYEHAFLFWNRGIASTLTTILILFLLIFISFIFRSIGKRVYYEVE